MSAYPDKLVALLAVSLAGVVGLGLVARSANNWLTRKVT